MSSVFKFSLYKIRLTSVWVIPLLMVVSRIVLSSNVGYAAEVDRSQLEEVPEEVLRSEILLDGRSALDGRRLSATEYTELLSELEAANTVEPQVDSKLRNLVGLVKLRKFIKTVLPIVPIK
jgi:hypothetical protein